MKKITKKKSGIKFYCNMFYFTMICSLFSTPYSYTPSYQEFPKISLSSAEYPKSVQLLLESTDIEQQESYMPYTDGIQFKSTRNLQKNYSGMNLSYELEDGIRELARQYDIPYQIVLTIGEQESNGCWNNNGVISATDDYGEFQINKRNLSYIEEQLGYTEEEILYDSLKNAEAAIFLLKDIINRDDVTSLEDVFGMYNGWVNWKNKSISVNYVNNCNHIMKEYFPNFEYNNNEDKSNNPLVLSLSK